MKKLKSMLKKSFAALLVTCLAVAPALSTTTVNAEETGATAISYQASIEKSENGSIQFADTSDQNAVYLLFALCLFIISCIYGIRKVRHK